MKINSKYSNNIIWNQRVLLRELPFDFYGGARMKNFVLHFFLVVISVLPFYFSLYSVLPFFFISLSWLFFINCHPAFFLAKCLILPFFLLRTPVLPIFFKFHPFDFKAAVTCGTVVAVANPAILKGGGSNYMSLFKCIDPPPKSASEVPNPWPLPLDPPLGCQSEILMWDLKNHVRFLIHVYTWYKLIITLAYMKKTSQEGFIRNKK